MILDGSLFNIEKISFMSLFSSTVNITICSYSIFLDGIHISCEMGYDDMNGNQSLKYVNSGFLILYDTC